MERSEEETQKRSCLVCGHPMGPLDRICDKCGSIRRPAKSLGTKSPTVRHSSCARCGEEIPFGKHYCEPCAAHVKEQKEHEKENAPPGAFKRLLNTFLAAIRRLFGRLE
jgi:predicted amidophosphoribosyltransferase